MKFIKQFISENSTFVFGCIVLLLLRIPTFVAPQISSDEGFYLSIGHLMNNGLLLYKDVWDNKPPLLYIIFALNDAVFGANLIGLRVINYFICCVTILLILQLGKYFIPEFKLRNTFIIACCVIVYSFAFEITLVNAENIFVPIVLGFIVLQTRINIASESKNTYKSVVFSSFLFCVALLTKLSTLAELTMITGAFLVVNLKYYFDQHNKSLMSLVSLVKHLSIFYFLMFGIPILIWGLVLSFYTFNNAFTEFFSGIIGFTTTYLDSPKKTTLFGLQLSLTPLVANFTLVCISFVFSTYLYIKTRVFENDSQLYVFYNWLTVGVFSLFISDRGYPHYLQQILPLVVLSIVSICYYFQQTNSWFTKLTSSIVPIFILNSILNSFIGDSGAYNWFYPNTMYNGWYKYSTRSITFKEWNSSFDTYNWTRRYALVEFVNREKTTNRIYFVGNFPEIYSYTSTINGYYLLVDYHFSIKSLNNNEDIERIIKHLHSTDTSEIFINSDSFLSSIFEDELEQSTLYRYSNQIKVESTTFKKYSII